MKDALYGLKRRYACAIDSDMSAGYEQCEYLAHSRADARHEVLRVTIAPSQR